MRAKFFGLFMLILAVAFIPATALATIQVFYENFDGVLSDKLSGITTVEGVQGYAGLGPPGNQFGGKFLRNITNPPQKTILTLTGLPAHHLIDINFLFGAIDSWDSSDGLYWATPDFFNVVVDGVLVFQATFANATGSITYPYGSLAYDYLGFAGWKDRAFDLSQAPELHNLVHTASSVTIEFFASGAGWQGGGDESWAIDNLEVLVHPVATPLPGTLILLGSSLLGLAGLRRL